MNRLEQGGEQMVITSSAFTAGGWIPEKYTQEGENISPPLTIKDIPASAQSLVLICLDPDAPDPDNPQRIFTHWVVYNLPAENLDLPAGVNVSELFPAASQGLNDRQTVGYIGPRPPIGAHRYFFKLFAINTKLYFANPPTRAKVLEAMDGNVVAMTEIVGRYKMKNPPTEQ